MAIIFYIILHRARLNSKLFLLLPLLMIIWVNCHGGFLVGFIIIGAYFLEALITRQTNYLKNIIYVGIACGTVTLINPIGIGVFYNFFEVMSDKMLPFIDEWKPISFKYPLHIVYMLIFLASFNPFSKKISLAEKLISLFWVFCAFQHERNIPIAVLLSAPALLFQIENWIDKLPSRMRSAIFKKKTLFTKLTFSPPIQLLPYLPVVFVFVIVLTSGGAKWMRTEVPADICL